VLCCIDRYEVFKKPSQRVNSFEIFLDAQRPLSDRKFLFGL
jgi:hypothetical protein